MLIKLLRAERIKLKRSPVWLAFFLMPIVPALLGTINYAANLELLKSEWYSLWTQHTIFTCYFFLPIMFGIYCAYLMRLEHNQQNWNKLLSMPAPRYMVFVTKLIVASGMVLLSEVWIGILFIISGKIIGLTGAFPYDVIKWILCGTLGGIVTVSIQLLLSMKIKNFALPVGIALAGGLSGLMALAKGFGHVWPYSLMAYGMRANAPQQLMEKGIFGFFVTCGIYIMIFVVAGSVLLAKEDI